MNHWTIDNVNYARDRRNCGRAKLPVLTDDDGVEIKLPTRWEVCPVCDGKGTHVNPAIDCGGISQDGFDQDPDFMESYMSGAYDQTCNHCGGRTTVEAVDWDRLTPAQRDAYDKQEQFEADYQAMCAAERRMGA